MQFSQDATLAINDYVDRVRTALPLSPSARLAAADRLYQDICRDAAAKAQTAGQTIVSADVVRETLAALGTPEDRAQRLAADASGASWQWPGDVFAGMYRSHRLHEKMDRFARVAAEQGERVAKTSLDIAVAALDTAAQKLREAAERLKSTP
ncbi:MAG TPA: hypothetical protein VEJ20_08625 [Candidatus Eremiobacteraceae bacterium]|nr:hypothetical protein [Candidatus Eremiobacteraceae bacterium]